jgi:alanine dehydrogenase
MKNPLYKSNVLHYCVPNILVILKQPHCLLVISSPYLIQIADDGGIESAIRCDKGLKCGVYLYHGILTSKTSDWFDLPNNDINLIVF